MYCLMNKDEKVAEIVVGKGILGHTYALSDARKDRLHIGFCHVEEWLENRKASKHNRRMKAIMQLCDCENKMCIRDRDNMRQIMEKTEEFMKRGLFTKDDSGK